MSTGRAAVVLVAVVALSACAPLEDGPSARAAHFYAAIAAEDGARACADLAPEARKSLELQEGSPCAEAILKQELPSVEGRGQARVYGSAAQVVHPGETAFLSRFAGGWRVTAAGCPPVTTRDRPHDCAIEVG